MTRSLSLMALFLVLAVGCGKKDATGTGGGGDDSARMQGSWVIAKIDDAGSNETPPKEVLDNMVVIVSGTSLKLEVKGKVSPDGHAVLKLDGSKSPKELDLTEADEKGSTDPRKSIVTVKDGKPVYNEMPSEVLKGIYKFDGDTVVVALGTPGTPRPTEFKASGDKKAGVIVATFKKK